MHQHLAFALRAYRVSTRGWPEAKRRLDRLASRYGFCAERQRRLTSRIDIARARLEWTLLPEHERVNLLIAEQRERVRQMRAQKGRTT
jgi:hypothetical protein